MNLNRFYFVSFLTAAAVFLTCSFLQAAGDLQAASNLQTAGEQTIKVNRIIEKEVIAGAQPNFSANACTFAIRAKFLAKGDKVDKASSERGMIFSVASGYFDGIRAWYSWENNSICFEIGRVPEKSSIGIEKSEVAPYVLHDIVCVYDGKLMRLYIDGALGIEREYTGKLESKNSPIKIGFVHYGIGWNKMFVDQLEYLPRAMTAAEVVQRYEKHPEEEKKNIALLAKFKNIPGAVNLNNDLPQFDKLMKLAENDPRFTDSIIREKWQRLIAEGNRESAIKAFPLLKNEAISLLNAELPNPETVSDYNQFVSKLYSATDALITVYKKTNNSQAASLVKKLRKKFPEPMKIRRKVDLLETQMIARAQKLEKESIERFEKLKKSASVSNSASAKTEIYLAPNGSDTNDGSASKPLATLAAALEKAGTASATGKTVLIQVADGTYHCEKTALLENKKISESAGPIFIQAAPNAKPVFTGKISLKGFVPVTDPAVLSRFDEKVRSKIVVCDLRKNGVTDFGAVTSRGYPVSDVMNPWTDLYVNGQAQTLARWPNEKDELLKFGDVIPGPNAVSEGRGKRSDSDTFRFDFDRPNKWRLSKNSAENDIWINGLFQWEWAGDTRKVLDIDLKNKLIKVDYKNISGKFHYYFRNILEELDAPGEFYIDRTSGLLYLYPPKNTNEAATNKADFQAELAVFNGPFVRLKNVAQCFFSGLTFTGCRTTGIWAENCVDCYLDQCLVEGMGVHAVIMKNCSWSGVFHSKLCKLGGCGIRLAGGDRASLTPSGLTVHDTEIATFCQVDRAYAAAVQTTGCGMTATNNLIYDSPHHAFRMDGNDQYCARNEVHSVVYEYSDQSGIDIYCDPMYRGIVIEKNFWHHIGSSLALCGQAGIRLDDSISGVVMTDNIFYRSSGGHFGGIQIHGGKDNLCARNLFVNCKKAFSFSPWGNDRYLRDFIHGSFGTNVKNYLEKKVYPFVDEDLEKYINRNFIFNNQMINCETFQSNGTSWDQFAGNSWKTIPSAPTQDGSLPTPQNLRKWIESISGRKISDIGLLGNPDSVKHFVSPHYSEN